MGATMLGLRIFRRRRVCRALEDGECCARCWQGLAEGSRGGWARCRGRWESCVGKPHFGPTFVHFFPRKGETGHSDFFEPDPPTTHSPCRRSRGSSKRTPKPSATFHGQRTSPQPTTATPTAPAEAQTEGSQAAAAEAYRSGVGVPSRAARRPGMLRRMRNVALDAGRGSRKAPEAVGHDVEGAEKSA